MALKPHLKELVDNEKHGKLGFEDVFELYAVLCVNQITGMVNDMIADEGIKELILNGMSFTVEGLTEQAVDWGHVVIPEMLSDVIEGPKKANESWLEYIIRRKIEEHVKETNSFQIKMV